MVLVLFTFSFWITSSVSHLSTVVRLYRSLQGPDKQTAHHASIWNGFSAQNGNCHASFGYGVVAYQPNPTIQNLTSRLYERGSQGLVAA